MIQVHRLLALTIFMILAVVVSAPAVVAQRAVVWAPAERVSGYAVGSMPPLLVPDQNGTVHAFNSQLIDDTMAVVYRKWSIETGWTEAVDILLSPNEGQARLLGAHLDQDDILHVVYFSGDDRNFDLLYSSAHAGDAGRAGSWSKPQMLATEAGPLSEGFMVGDADGRIFVLYSGRQAGLGLYEVHSLDSGESWSEASPVYLTYSLARWASAIQAVFDANGALHAVWTVANQVGNGEALYHSRLEPAAGAWSSPMMLASATVQEYEADEAAIVEHNGELIVIYHKGMPPTRLMRRSSDRGVSWSEPVRPFDEQWQGTYGPVAFVHDSSQVLHALLGNRRGTPAVHGMWHSVWQDGRWSNLEPVVSGPQVRSNALGTEFDPANPQAAVMQGNTLLLTWRTDPGVGPNGIWFSYAILDAPELPVVPLAAPQATPSPTAAATSTPWSLPTPAARNPEPAGISSSERNTPFADGDVNSVAGWTLTVAPVLLLISAAVVARFSRLFGRR